MFPQLLLQLHHLRDPLSIVLLGVVVIQCREHIEVLLERFRSARHVSTDSQCD